MATQTIATYGRQSAAAMTPVIHPQILSRRCERVSRRQDLRLAQERQRALVAMLPLVKRVAFTIREHLPAHVELDDLVANGVLGLVDAVAKFDPRKRVKLESYARHRVRGAILDGLRSADPAGRDLRRNSKRIQKVYRELEGKLGRPVEDEEIAAELGMDMAQWHRSLNEAQSVGFEFGARIISAGPNTKRPTAEVTQLAGDDVDPFDRCYRHEQREILNRALGHLRERERQIITLYYQQELTMKQIAERLSVDESRISQLHSAALARLKAGVDSFLNPRQAGSEATAPLAMTAGAAN